MKIFVSYDAPDLPSPPGWLDPVLEGLVAGVQSSNVNDQVEAITISDGYYLAPRLDQARVLGLDRRISLVTGFPRRGHMMEGVKGHDLAILLGYQAGAGQHRASYDRTLSPAFHRVTVNGLKLSLASINALYAKEAGVPVGLIVGDSGLYDLLIREGYMDYVSFVTNQDSSSSQAARLKNPLVLKDEVALACQDLLAKDPASLRMPDLAAPYNLIVEFSRASQADYAQVAVGSRRLDGYRLSVTLDRIQDLLDTLYTWALLAERA